MNRQTFAIIASGLALLLVALFSCFFGATFISPWDVVQGLFGTDHWDATEKTILLELRLPRVIVGAMAGGSLAVAGVGFQGLFRNPLAEPYVIGASSGAALGVSIVIISGLQISFWSLGATTLMAMLGSIAVVMIVLAMGTLSNNVSPTVLLLCGVVISSMINAVVSLLMFLFDQKAVVILSWLMGSLASSHWGTAIMVLTIGSLSLVAMMAMARALDAYALGDTTAQSLGLDLTWFRRTLIAASSLATAGAVAAAGVIGFVGLLSPHLARMLVGTRHVLLIPMSFCLGAILMLVADVLARTIITPAEMPVGIITAILGCPFFLWLMLTGHRNRSLAGSSVGDAS